MVMTTIKLDVAIQELKQRLATLEAREQHWIEKLKFSDVTPSINLANVRGEIQGIAYAIKLLTEN